MDFPGIHGGRGPPSSWSKWTMWYLIEDFFEQSLVMKGFIALGWLCVVIMLASLLASLA